MFEGELLLPGISVKRITAIKDPSFLSLSYLGSRVQIDHFTVLCSVTWPLNKSEAGVDFALIQT